MATPDALRLQRDREMRDSVLFYLLRRPFTSTWAVEIVLGLCQAKQKHVVRMCVPKTERGKGRS